MNHREFCVFPKTPGTQLWQILIRHETPLSSLAKQLAIQILRIIAQIITGMMGGGAGRLAHIEGIKSGGNLVVD